MLLIYFEKTQNKEVIMIKSINDPLIGIRNIYVINSKFKIFIMGRINENRIG